MRLIKLFLLSLLHVSLFSQGILVKPIESISASREAIRLQSGLVVALATLRPGAEDWMLAEYLSETVGARVHFIYFTNGEGTPTGQTFGNETLLGAALKETADNCTRAVGLGSYFLNSPDPGLLATEEALGSLWKKDSVVRALVTAFRVIRPHAVFLTEDHLYADRPSRISSSLSRFVIDAVSLAKDPSQRLPSILPASDAWNVQQVFVESEPSPTALLLPPGSSAEVTRKYGRYRGSAKTAFGGLFSTRDERFGLQRSYRVAYPRRSVVKQFGQRIQSTTTGLTSSKRFMQRTARSVMRGDRNALRNVSAAIDTVSHLISLGLHQRTELDRRAIVHWKQNLESLQLSLSKAQITFTLSDSIVTKRQVFFMIIHLPDSIRKNGTTQILFQKGGSDGWLINESGRKVFDLSKDTVFRIVTPDSMQFNFPVAIHGLDKPVLREQFFFGIVHQSATKPVNRFLLNGVFNYRVGPLYAAIIERPLVSVAGHDPFIVYSLNITRDPVDGLYSVEDGACSIEPKRVVLGGKGMSRDTLKMEWNRDSVRHERAVPLLASGRTVGFFRGIDLEIAPPNVGRVKIVSDLAGPMLQTALQRLGLDTHIVHGGALIELLGDTLNSLIVGPEQGSWEMRRPEEAKALDDWIFAGGHLIVFTGIPRDEAMVLGEDTVRILPGTGMPADAPVQCNSGNFLRFDSTAAGAVWGGWRYARSYGALDLRGARGFSVVAWSSSGGPLIATKHKGKGKVTLVALNIEQQLLSFHRGSYVLLASLLD